MKVNHQAEALSRTALVKASKVNADGSVQELEDSLVREHRLEIRVNETPLARLVCTPSHLAELVMGRLLTEGILDWEADGSNERMERSANKNTRNTGNSAGNRKGADSGSAGIKAVEQLYICESGHTARVFLKEGVRLRKSMSPEPTCCTDNRQFLERQESEALRRLVTAEWKQEWVFAMAEAFARDSRLHRETKGTHSCYLGVRGEVVFSAEDIGRHNALDKCIGYGLLHGFKPEECMLFTTGRVPADMARKAIAAGVPVLASKAVPTEEAVRMAEKYHLTLLCKAWPDSFVIYNRG